MNACVVALVVALTANGPVAADSLEIHYAPEERLDALTACTRMKRGGAYMHLKAYEIDDAILRTGSANFSRSGERDQDNDLIVIRNPEDALRFEGIFNRIWGAAE